MTKTILFFLFLGIVFTTRGEYSKNSRYKKFGRSSNLIDSVEFRIGNNEIVGFIIKGEPEFGRQPDQFIDFFVDGLNRDLTHISNALKSLECHREMIYCIRIRDDINLQDGMAMKVETSMSDSLKQEFRLNSQGFPLDKLPRQHFIHFESSEYTFYCRINDLDNWETVRKLPYRKLLNDYGHLSRERKFYKQNRKYVFGVESDNSLLLYETKIINNRTPYFKVQLEPMFGSSMVKGEMSCNLGMSLGMIFNDYSRYALKVFTRYEMKVFYFYYKSENKTIPNGFADLGFGINMADDTEPREWLEFGGGYLFQRDPNIFDDKTCRIFMRYCWPFKLSIQPEVFHSFESGNTIFGFTAMFSFAFPR